MDLRETYVRIGQNMMMLEKLFKKYLRHALRVHDLGSSEAMVLMTLLTRDGQSQEEMIESLGIDKGVMTRTMKLLEDKGYVVRRAHPTDRRAKRVFTTEKTRGMAPVLFGVLEDWSALITRGTSHESLVEFEQILTAMVSKVNLD